MISAKEIRIGNLVTVDNEEYHPTIKGQPLVVEEIWLIGNSLLPKSNYGFTLTNGTDNYSQAEEFIQPIEITEEWLIKFGADCFQDGWYKIEFVPVVIRWNIYDKTVRALGYSFGNIKHLHQLQNLYFALTGKELTLNK